MAARISRPTLMARRTSGFTFAEARQLSSFTASSDRAGQ
jgi:hypothetical protein